MNMRWFLISICVGSITQAHDHTTGLHNYLWANYYHFGGNTQEAHARYKDMTESSSSIYTQKGYLMFLYSTGNYAAVAQMSERLPDAFKDDAEIQLTIGLSLKKSGKKNEADAHLVALSNKFKDHAEIAFHASEIYIQRKELENALLVVDSYLNNAVKKPNTFIFIFLKAQICAQLGRLPEALEYIKICLEKQPRFDKGWLLFALIQEQAGKIEDAIEGYNSYLELSDEQNQHIKQHLVGLALRQKMVSQNKQIMAHNVQDLERCMLLFRDKKYDEALKLINETIAKQDTVPHRLMKIQILAGMNAFEDAINELTTWITTKNAGPGPWLQTLYLLHNTQAPLERVIAAFEKIGVAQPQNSFVPLYLADLYARSGNQKQALNCYEKLLKLTEDPLLLSKIYYQIAAQKYEAGNYEEMVLIAGKALDVKKDFAPANNLLAYYYATRGKDLTRAQELLDKALAVAPNNPHYRDTQAVILYKQGKHKEALTILEEGAAKAPHDATIHIHLAKVHKKLSQEKQALDAIKHAALHAHTQRESEHTKKLAQRWSTNQT